MGRGGYGALQIPIEQGSVLPKPKPALPHCYDAIPILYPPISTENFHILRSEVKKNPKKCGS